MSADPDPVPGLAAHAAFLRGLARALVRDRHSQDDLVQETWLRALEHPPRHPGNLRAWLAQVLRRTFLNLLRGGKRRRAREGAAAGPGVAPSTLETAAYREQIRWIGEAVLALPEPFQEALVSRFYQGLGYAEIARRQAVEESTARTRVHRALALLRERLDGVHGGDRRAWLEALAPLAGFGPHGWASAAAAFTLGGFLMKNLAIIGGTVLLLAAGLLFVLDGEVRITPGKAGVEAPPPPEGVAFVPEAPPGNPSNRICIPPEPKPPEAEGWLVRVTASSGPVAGAMVCLLDEVHSAEPDACRRVMRAALPEETDYARIGLVLQADAEGGVRIPRPSLRPSVLIGWKNDLWGRLDLLSPAPPPLELPLEPDLGFRAQVVDGEGRPVVGVPVSLLRIREDAREVLAGRETGEQGLAEFRHLKSLERIVSGSEAKLAVMLALPMDREEGRLVDLAGLPAEPIRLVLPPAGSVVVAVEVAAGPLPDGQGFVSLFRRDAQGYPSQPPALPVPVLGGLARFPFVGLGLALEARCRRLSPEGKPLGPESTATGFGPTAAGQEVRLRLIIDGEYPRLSGRIRDDHGRPFSSRTLQASLSRPGDRERGFLSRYQLVRTDAEGRFDLPMEGGAGASGEWLLHLATLVLEQEEKLEGRAVLWFPLPLGGVDLGVIRLSLPPVLVSGRVVGGRGEPLPGVVVHARPLGSTRGGWAPTVPLGPETSLSTLTCEAGRFQIRGAFPAERLHIDAVRPDLGSTAADAAAGSVDLTLVLLKSGGVSASLLLPGEACWAFLSMTLEPEAENKKTPVGAERAEGSPRVSFSDLPPGSYTFLVSGSFSDEPLIRIPGIEVRSGETTRDPRMQDLDLRTRIQLLDFEVATEEGPAMAGFIFLERSRPPAGFIVKGKARLLAPAGPVNLVLVVPGQGEHVVENARNGLKVVLARGLLVRVHIQGGQPELPPGCTLRARLVPLAVAHQRSGKSVPVEGGRAEFKVGAPGPHVVHWSLLRVESLPGGGRRESEGPVPGARPQELLVKNQPGPQDFKVDFDLRAGGR